jgi:hypothetical protein
MPKPNKPEAQDSTETATVSTEKPSAKTPTTVKVAKPRYVRVENKRRQGMTLSVLNDDGQAVEMKLEPLATSDPIREDFLTEQVRRLAREGALRIR